MYHNQYNKAILFRVVASEVVLKACSAQIWVNLKESIKNGFSNDDNQINIHFRSYEEDP